MVEHAINCLPDEVLDKLSEVMESIYTSETPWAAFKERLRSVLGEDPSAVMSRFATSSLDASSGLARHAELARMLDSIPDLRSAMLKWSVLRLVAPSDQESFSASHSAKPAYDFAKEVDLYLSRKSFTPEINDVRNQEKKKDTLCRFHRKFGAKARRCLSHSKCPPLISNIGPDMDADMPPISNVLWSEPIPSSDSE